MIINSTSDLKIVSKTATDRLIFYDKDNTPVVSISLKDQVQVNYTESCLYVTVSDSALYKFTVYSLYDIDGKAFTPMSVSDYDSEVYRNKLKEAFEWLHSTVLISCCTGGTGGLELRFYPDFASFPDPGTSGLLYIDEGGDAIYYWDGTVYVSLGPSGFVPYTGATQDVDLGDYGIKVDHLDFNQTPAQAVETARMVWNDTDGTVDLGLKGGNVTLQIGQEEVVRVVNGTGGDLQEAAYQAVKVVGAQGQRLQVELAQADSDANSATTIGIVTETILNNQEGFITTNGMVREINTTGSLQGETWTDGDILYLSPTTAGAITNVKPTSPEHLVVIGYVVYAHVNHGKIFVKVDNGYELEELHNVLITSPRNGQWLQYNESLGVWENTSLFNYSINFKDVVQHEVILPYDWKITSIGSNPSSLSVTIELNGSAYTLGDTITANTDVITIDVDAVGFINLICDTV